MYTYILQENVDGLWLDKYSSNERAYIEELLKVFRDKYRGVKFRVVRLII